MHDKANVAGAGRRSTMSGNVTFTFYPNGTCTGAGTGAGTVTVTGGVAHPSTSQGPLGAGGYSFKARYNGSSNYNADDRPCEPLRVYTITTSLTSTTGQSGPKITVAQGAIVSDVATLGNAPSNAGGTVTYTCLQRQAPARRSPRPPAPTRPWVPTTSRRRRTR